MSFLEYNVSSENFEPTIDKTTSETFVMQHNAERLSNTEQALQRSEQQYCMLMEKLDEGIAIVQKGRIVFVNTALCTMLGEQVSTLLHKAPCALFGTDDVSELNSMNEETFQPSKQIHYTTSDGRTLWIEQSQNWIQWKGGMGLAVILKDITAHKVYELAFEAKKLQLWSKNTKLKKKFGVHGRFGDIVGHSQNMQRVYELIIQAAETEHSVLIHGESGTGKELVARMVWQVSSRNKENFVPVNCGAIPENLFESEMFGHCKGAFTGANVDKPGCFDRAHRGVLFLDEVGELSSASQVKLLRVLETGEYCPVGGTSVKRSEVRIITATHRNLLEMVKTGEFREDLFYRLYVIEINVPPLRDRKEDLPYLIDFFEKRLDRANQHTPLSQDILNVLCAHHWPGNVRELYNVLCRYITTGALIFADSHYNDQKTTPDILKRQDGNLKNLILDFEKHILKQALQQHNWDRQKVSSMLNVAPRTLRRKINKHQIMSPLNKKHF